MTEQRELSPYRENLDTAIAVPQDHVILSREAFANLERDSAILRELEDHWLRVERTDHRRWSWEVEMYTGEYSDVYPRTTDGKGKTLRGAIEDAFDWEPVEPWYPEPDPTPRKVLIGFLVGVAASALTIFLMQYWWG